MQLPFTTEQFFAVFGAYNTAVWPAQGVLLALAVFALVVIARRPAWGGTAVSAILAGLWAWLAVAYHVVFFTGINPLAWAFAAISLTGAALFAWQGVWHRRLRFALDRNLRTVAGVLLIAFSLVVYPVWSTLAGHGYPQLPTFGLPCPTTIFTIGVLALGRGRVLRLVLVVPLLWSLVGSQAAFLLDVRPDLGLLAAAIVAAALLVSPGGDRNAPGEVPHG